MDRVVRLVGAVGVVRVIEMVWLVEVVGWFTSNSRISGVLVI